MSAGRKIANRNIALITVHTLMLNMLFVIPVIVPYYRDVIGIGFREFMIGEALFCAVIVLMEVPTGWIADIWTRKRTMIAGMIINIIGYLWLWRADSLFDALGAQAVLGVSVSLLSGTISALLYDSLLEEGREDEFRKREGFRVGFGLYVIGTSCLAGGFLYEIDPRLPAFLSFFTSLLGLGASLLVIEPNRHREPVHKNPFADMVKTVRYAVHGHAEIAGIIIMSAVLFACTKTLMWAQQPYYIMLDLPAAWFGILAAAGFFLGGMGGHFGHMFDGRFRNLPILASAMIWVFMVCIICAVFPGYPAVAFLLTGATCVFGIAWPRMQAAINRRVGSARRATILSAANLSVNCVAIPLMFAVGAVSDGAGVRAALLCLAAALAGGGAIAAFLIKRMARKAAG